MILPKAFDANEWFIIISLIITTVVLFLLPKRFPTSITILILIYGTVFARATDRILGAKPYNLYEMNDTPKFDLMDLFTWCMYPAFGYLFLYLYERLKLKGVYTVMYLVVFALFSTGFEWITVKVGIFEFKNWKSLYSFPTYLIIQPLYLLFFCFLKKYYKPIQNEDH